LEVNYSNLAFQFIRQKEEPKGKGQGPSLKNHFLKEIFGLIWIGRLKEFKGLWEKRA